MTNKIAVIDAIAILARLGGQMEVVGDDIFVTNTRYIARGIEENTANSVLIKLNQIDTVTRTIEAVNMCRDAGWRYFISHRSGETEDVFIADFAVAMDGSHLKTGSISLFALKEIRAFCLLDFLWFHRVM